MKKQEIGNQVREVCAFALIRVRMNTTLCKLIVYRMYPTRIVSVNLQMPSIYNSRPTIIGHISFLYHPQRADPS